MEISFHSFKIQHFKLTMSPIGGKPQVWLQTQRIANKRMRTKDMTNVCQCT